MTGLKPGHYMSREGFEFGKRAAGGDAGFLKERGVQDEGAAIDKGVIGWFEGFARAAGGGSAGDEVFIHFQVGLKVEGVADIPALVAGEASKEFLAEGGGLLPGHGLGFPVVFGGQAPGDDIEGASNDGQQCLALEKIQEIAIEDGVNLQAVAPMLDHVGIDEVGDDALAEKGFAEALREKSREVVGGRFGF
jgi:hypothetical protein